MPYGTYMFLHIYPPVVPYCTTGYNLCCPASDGRYTAVIFLSNYTPVLYGTTVCAALRLHGSNAASASVVLFTGNLCDALMFFLCVCVCVCVCIY